MNKKVVIIWGAFIFIFALLGVLGLSNQDLVKKEKENDEDTSKIVYKTCENKTDIERYTYLFILSNNEVIGLRYEYESLTGNQVKLGEARELNDLNITGLSSKIEDTENGFIFSIVSDSKNLDTNEVSEHISEILNFEVIFDDTKDLDTYIKNINNSNTMDFTCEVE